MSFNFNKYKANNPLLQEVEEEVTVSSSGVEMEEANYDNVNAAFNATLEAMRSAIKARNLSNDDVYELRIKLAEFFK